MKYWKELPDDIKINSDTIICLDIEVSSYWIDGSKIIEWDKNLSDDYYNNSLKGSCVYIWMVGIEENIYYGREFQELKDFLHVLEEKSQYSDKESIYIYVHNLPYEFQFLRNLLDFENVFGRQVRKPMKARYKCFEFRCSYSLTHLSLESWGKQIGLEKAVGELDYIKIRSPKTILTKEELHYCERDIAVMYKGLVKYREKYKHIKSIPLTQTGEVRKVYKKLYKHQPNYNRRITKLLPKDREEYLIKHQLFGGGDTHGNSINVNVVIRDEDIGSKDEASAYPAVMFAERYPMSRFIEVQEGPADFNFERFCYAFYIRLYDVKKKGSLTYLARSRCVSVSGGIYDNGRIAAAKEIFLYCTENEYIMIQRLYDCKMEIIKVRKAIKGYLDKKYVNYIIELYRDKTQLKGVAGYEDLYMQQKQYLNSLYGCMVTDIVQPQIIYDNKTGWRANTDFNSLIDKALQEAHEKFYKNYLSYDWGYYVTSHARFRLWDMILKLPEDDVIYFDTDSCKIKHFHDNEHLFVEANKKVIAKNEEACKHFKMPLDAFRPVTPKGKESILGTWEDDGLYKAFKCLGAKKYCYEDMEGKLHITVSGVPKRAVKCLKSIEDFKEDFVFDNDTCRKGLATYLEPQAERNPKVILPDGYVVDQPYGINLRNIGYTLGLTQEFKNYLQGLVDWSAI